MCIAAAIAGAAVVGAGASIYAGNKAADAQEKASQNSIQEQQRQYDQSRTDLAPWRSAGQNALGQLSNPTANFQASPDYAFRQSQGMQGIERSASARGGAFSGNALKALASYNSNLASGEFGNWWNRQAGLAGVGQAATNTTTQAGLITSGNISNNLLQQGDARASGIINQGNQISGALNSLAGAGGYFLGNRGNYGNGYVTSGAFGSNPSGNAAAGQYADWSDRRLKTDIHRIGEMPSGLPVYRFRYVFAPTEVRTGVMADEVMSFFPDAVVHDPSGYLKVKYAELG